MEPVALVVGASRGIGRAAAFELAKRGYRLGLVARSESLAAVAEQIKGSLGVAADVSDPDEAASTIERMRLHFGRLDAIVNCAGLAPAAPVEQTSVETWRRVVDTNLSSAFYLAKAVWPIFRARQGGVIVLISSLACRDPLPGFAAYGAAKAGLNLLGLSLAREGAAMNVRVHTIAPGAVETEMFRKLASKEQWPPEKTLAPEDVARVIAACVQGDLRYTSGEVIFLQKTL